tara:strand:- start:30310 stop:31641 length:1332 start_codon:yes stop_codon:yes gene_type:complete
MTTTITEPKLLEEPQERPHRTVILDGEMTHKDVARELRNSPEPNTITHLWTRDEVTLLREFSPSTYHKLAQDPTLGLESFTDIEHRLPQLALQLQTEVSHRSATMDCYVLGPKKGDEGTLRSKFHHLSRLTTLFDLLNIPHPGALSPDLLEGTPDLRELFIETRLRYAELLQNMPEWANPEITTSTETKTANFRKLPIEQQRRFGYVDHIKRLVGEKNLVAVAVYGSATQTTENGDYDNYVVIQDGSLPTVCHRLLDQDFVNQEDGKHVGMNILQEGAFSKFIRMNQDSYERRVTGILLYGSLQFPILSDEEDIERGISSTMLRRRTLGGAATHLTHDPERLLGRPDLFQFFQKTLRSMEKAGLNLREGIFSRSNATLDARLEQDGIHIRPYKDDLAYLHDGIYDALAAATHLTHKYFAGTEFKGNFLEVTTHDTPSTKPLEV